MNAIEGEANIARQPHRPATPSAGRPQERAARKPEWDVVAPKIVRREWSELRDIWLSNPVAGSTRSERPPEPAESLASLRAAAVTYAADRINILPVEHDRIVGLHGAVLLDSLFLFNKAVHVLSGAQIHIDAGMCSWSLSSAYQSAFFAMKASAALLGVSVAEIDSNTYVVDLCAESATAKRTRNNIPPKIIRLMKCQRVEHRQYWGLFRRLLRVCPVPREILAEGVVEALTRLEITDFASQRNKLHYGNTSWIFDDLQKLMVRADFGVNVGAIRDGSAIDVDRDDFSVVLAIALVSFTYRLFADIAKDSNAIGEELNFIQEWLRDAPNERYLSAYPQDAA